MRRTLLKETRCKHGECEEKRTEKGANKPSATKPRSEGWNPYLIHSATLGICFMMLLSQSFLFLFE